MVQEIKVRCPQCKRGLKVSAKHAGKKVKCPGCEATLRIPAAKRKPSPAPVEDEAYDTSDFFEDEDAAEDAAAGDDYDYGYDDDYGLDDGGGFDGYDDGYGAAPAAMPRRSRKRKQKKGGQSVDVGSSDITVEGKLIRGGTRIKLPKVCVKTGAVRNLQAQSTTLKHSPPWAYAVGGVLLALALQKKCDVSYFLSEEVLEKRKKNQPIGILILAVGVMLLIADVVQFNTGVLGVVGVLSVIAGIVWVARTSANLHIKRHEGGHTFWIAGCSDEFFDRIS